MLRDPSTVAAKTSAILHSLSLLIWFFVDILALENKRFAEDTL